MSIGGQALQQAGKLRDCKCKGHLLHTSVIDAPYTVRLEIFAVEINVYTRVEKTSFFVMCFQ